MSGFIAASNTKTILSATHLVSSISIFLCIITYISWGGSLSARKVFFISCFFNILNEGMIKEWPQSLMTFIQLNVSCKRVTEFLLEGVSTLENKRYQKSKGNSLVFENVSARWETNIESIQNNLKNITLKVEHTSLVGVIGQVGSGKTTLLKSILGEIFITEGNLKVGGKLSYASQDPWVFQGTVKDNIVFVEEYDPVRYAEVVKACALLPDFKRFPDGDETVIGERGVTLSGGQKARISLARATRFLKDVDQVVILKNGVVENQVNFENTFLKDFEMQKGIVHEEDLSKDKFSLNENHSKKKKALKDENSVCVHLTCTPPVPPSQSIRSENHPTQIVKNSPLYYNS
uniref:ABC transporter domain-containing protein n=1 Tax=Megaselia scalaris TaxID=36166 RepID=T1GG36_MEGSC